MSLENEIEKNSTEKNSSQQPGSVCLWKDIAAARESRELQVKKEKPKFKISLLWKKIKIFCVDHWHLLFKSAAVNHLRIQELKSNVSFKEKCSLTFSSYTHLKRYQKKVRLLTGSFFSTTVSIFAMILAMQVFFPGSRSLGATYTWAQNSWAGGTDAITTATHDLNKTNWNKYFSKDANIEAANNGEDLRLVETGGITTQTDDAAFNAGTKSNVTVTNGSIKLDMLP